MDNIDSLLRSATFIRLLETCPFERSQDPDIPGGWASVELEVPVLILKDIRERSGNLSNEQLLSLLTRYMFLGLADALKKKIFGSREVFDKIAEVTDKVATEFASELLGVENPTLEQMRSKLNEKIAEGGVIR